MRIIPVIDLKGGLAVRAVAGERASYRPLVTPLAAGADPVAVAEGLRALYPFPVLYVADLDGIEGRGADAALQARVAVSWAGGTVWIDDGAAEGEVPGRTVKVVGSETLPAHATSEVLARSSVLSLDFRGDDFLGPAELLSDARLWPDDVIVMTLARVGTDAGPDLARVADIASRAGRGRRVFAAGGVRDTRDLAALSKAGAAGALIASALHAGTIKTGDLEEIAGW